MKQTINKCPKVMDKYSSWLNSRMKEKYPDKEVEHFLKANLFAASIESNPISMTYFFDDLNLKGDVRYNKKDDVFLLMVNGELIQNDYQFTKDRKEGEEILIKYLFIEAEKTL